jgi:hypothetical protein
MFPALLPTAAFSSSADFVWRCIASAEFLPRSVLQAAATTPNLSLGFTWGPTMWQWPSFLLTCPWVFFGSEFFFFTGTSSGASSVFFVFVLVLSGLFFYFRWFLFVDVI